MTFSFSQERDRARELAVAGLGAEIGDRIADLARPGFRLDPVGEGELGASRSWLGGEALLEPGTEWPESCGKPLEFFATLHMGDFAAIMGDVLPLGADQKVLNFFWGAWGPQNSDDGCRVVAAAADRAISVPPPEAANSDARREMLRVTPGVTLPDESAYECIEGLDYDAMRKLPHQYWDPAKYTNGVGGREGHQAFGWCSGLQISPVGREADHVLLALRLDLGDLFFVITEENLRAGAFHRAECDVQTD